MKYIVVFMLFCIALCATDGRKCPSFWNKYSKTNYPTRAQYIAGLKTLVGKKIVYTQTNKRWSGIDNKTCPPSVPSYADCSSFATWAYWTAFGGLPDTLNKQSWKAGYTGSMTGKKVDKSKCEAGYFVLYKKGSKGHATTSIGGGKVITYGATEGVSTAIRIVDISYRSDYFGCYLPDFPFGQKLTSTGTTPSGDKRKCTAFWNNYSKTAYPSRAQFIAGLKTLVGKKIVYTQSSKRWSGISNKTCPPSVPSYADCSSFATWFYWTAFGGLPDTLNKQSWTAGYTGSMTGKKVDKSKCQAGDFVLYKKGDKGHATISIGGGNVITYGATEGVNTPVRQVKIGYRSDYYGCFTPDFPFGQKF